MNRRNKDERKVLQAIADVISTEFGTRVWYQGRSRIQKFSMARKIFCYVGFMSGVSIIGISDFLGYRNHTSAVHHRDTFEDLLVSWDEFEAVAMLILRQTLDGYGD